MEDNTQKFVQRREKQNRKASGTSHPSPGRLLQSLLNKPSGLSMPASCLHVSWQFKSPSWSLWNTNTIMLWLFFLPVPTSRKVLSTFHTFCPFGIQIVQTVVHFAHFQVQARKRGLLVQNLGWGSRGWGCFVYVYIPDRGVWRLSKEQGLGMVFLENETPSGQNETHLGNLY